ncbi:MAG: glycerophosphodiester phosphodiesterase [Actinomycetota bacterium]|nr:glycerophosphodiester phosphodiesterase [Actinomycetota bacterium]
MAAAKPAPADEQVLNIGHRGASGLAPEHTFAAYDLALKQGADYIEQDLQQTSDGTLVVIHDATLDRTARGPAENCTGLVSEKTLEQLKTCDVGLWFNETYPDRAREEYVGLEIPTLEEVLRRYRHRTNYYIETKNPDNADRMEERLVALLDEYNLLRPAADRWQVLVQSFSPESLLRLRALEPELPLIQLFSGSETSATIQARLDAVAQYAVGIGPSKNDVDAALVEAAHERCLDIHPYTVNDSEEMRDLIDVGVDGMFTNFPARLDEVLGRDAVGGKHAAKRAADAHAGCVAGV